MDLMSCTSWGFFFFFLEGMFGGCSDRVPNELSFHAHLSRNVYLWGFGMQATFDINLEV